MELLDNVYVIDDFVKVVVDICQIGVYMMDNWCVVMLVYYYYYQYYWENYYRYQCYLLVEVEYRYQYRVYQCGVMQDSCYYGNVEIVDYFSVISDVGNYLFDGLGIKFV